MHTVNQLYLKSLIKHARRQGIDDALFSAEIFKERIPLELQGKIWEVIRQKAGPLLGFDFGNQLEPMDLGVFGPLLMSAATLGDALEFLQAFYPVIGEGGIIRVEKNCDTCSIIYIQRYEVAREVRTEAVIANLISTAKSLSSEHFQIKTINFNFLPAPVVIERFKTFAQCEVYTSQTYSQVQIPIESLEGPLEHANPDIVNSLLPTIRQQLSELHSVSPFQSAGHFIYQYPELSRTQLASKMKISERSLSRYLSQSGSTFAEIRRQARQCHAEQCLTSGYSVEKIAERLAYSDASAFIKGFKKWTGLTPLQYRRKMQSL